MGDLIKSVEIKRFGALRKYPKDIGMGDFYNHYISRLDEVELKNGYNLPKKLHNKILEEINLGIRNLLLEGTCVKLPYRLGELYIVQKELKPYIDKDGELKNILVDWASTRELWKNDPEAFQKETKVYYQNDHTDKAICSILWRKQKSNVPNQSVYKFILIRSAKRELSRRLKRVTDKPSFYTLKPYYINVNH